MKRLISILTSIIITTASLIGVPTKAYALKVLPSVPENKYCKPKIWTPHLSKMYAQSLIKNKYPNWNKGQWKALVKLWNKESHWNPRADNPKSTAYGIAQVLGTKRNTPAPQQVARGLAYINHRYKTPSIAWAHHRKHGWY